MTMFRPMLVACVPLLFAAPAFAALVVSKGATSNVSCASGVCTATAADAVLNVRDLKHLLDASDLRVESGSAAADIVFDAKMAWTKPHRLTLDAFRSIAFNLALVSEGTGGVTLTTNDGGSGGELAFAQKGKVTFWDKSSSLVIDGDAYTLAGDIASLAAGIAANPNGSFALMNFYDASADGAYKSNPVPTAFGGKFEGLGHTISGLTLDPVGSFRWGFFDTIATGGVVRDLTFEDARMNTKAKNDVYSGLLAAISEGTVSHVNAAVAIVAKGGIESGGLVGWNQGTVSWCAVSGNLQGSGSGSAVGGVVSVNAGTIVHSHSAAVVQGAYAGGLVSFNEGSIAFSYATGAAGEGGGSEVDDPFAGGLVARNEGTIDQSFATGAVTGGSGGHLAHHGHPVTVYAAGITVLNYGTITNTYATGAVTVGSKAFSGGFTIGSQDPGAIISSYSTGTVVRNGRGGRDGFSHGSPNGTNDYWDIDTSGAASGCSYDCSGVTGLTTAQFQSGLPAGFDPAVWGESPSINNGYPYLLANPPQ